MLAIVFPGQGSQSPGLLAPWLELPGVADRLHWMSAVVGDDLVAHGTVSDADTLRDTAVAQPLIVATGLLALRELVASPAELAATAGVVVHHVTTTVPQGIDLAVTATTPLRTTGSSAGQGRLRLDLRLPGDVYPPHDDVEHEGGAGDLGHVHDDGLVGHLACGHLHAAHLAGRSLEPGLGLPACAAHGRLAGRALEAALDDLGGPFGDRHLDIDAVDLQMVPGGSGKLVHLLKYLHVCRLHASPPRLPSRA